MRQLWHVPVPCLCPSQRGCGVRPPAQATQHRQTAPGCVCFVAQAGDTPRCYSRGLTRQQAATCVMALLCCMLHGYTGASGCALAVAVCPPLTRAASSQRIRHRLKRSCSSRHGGRFLHCCTRPCHTALLSNSGVTHGAGSACLPACLGHSLGKLQGCRTAPGGLQRPFAGS